MKTLFARPAVFAGPLAWVVMVATAGCTAPISRIDRHREVYESWPLDIRQAVLDGKVDVGMTPDMVLVALGSPMRAARLSGLHDDVWIYLVEGSWGGTVNHGGGIYPRGTNGAKLAARRMGGSSVDFGSMITPGQPPKYRQIVFRDGIVYLVIPP